MADEKVPENRAKTFRVRRHPLGVHRRDDDARLGDLPRESAVAADDAVDTSANLGCQLESENEVPFVVPDDVETAAVGDLECVRERANRVLSSGPSLKAAPYTDAKPDTVAI